MSNQLEEIRQLKGQGISIRVIAGKLSISKYEVEKAFLRLKVLSERPDTDSNSCLDEEPDIWPDSQPQSSGQVYSTMAGPKSPKDLPSEWHSGVTRFEADFIITNYIEKYTPLEIKGLYEDEYPMGYISLNDIRKVIQAYEQEEIQQSTAKLAVKKAATEQLLQQFINFVGDDALAFLL